MKMRFPRSLGMDMLFALDDAVERRVASGVCSEIPLPNGEPPEWVRLLPPGPAIEAVDGRKWRVDNAAELVRASLAWPLELQVDYDHAALRAAPEGRPAPASGWIKDLRVAADGAIEGRVEWTPEGAAAIKAKKWKYISPDFSAPRGAIRRISGAGLTNRPALVQAPLTADQEVSMDKKILQRVLAALGLAEGASEEEIAAACERLQAAAQSPPPDRFVPRAQYDALAQRANDLETAAAARGEAERKAAAEAAVEQAMSDGKVAPASKDYWLGVCASEGGLEQFEAFLASAPAIPGTGDGTQASASAAKPGRKPGSAATATAEDLEVASQFGIDAEFLEKHGGLQHG